MHPNRNDYRADFSIYSVRSVEGNVVAVGQTSDIKERRRMRSWKHGEGFIIRVEMVLPASTRGEAKRIERNLQDHFGVPDEQRSEGWRKVVSEKATGRLHSEEAKKKMSDAQKGKFGIDCRGTRFVFVGTHIDTGETITLIGSKSIKEAGFGDDKIRACISGKKRNYKGYVWEKHSLKEYGEIRND